MVPSLSGPVWQKPASNGISRSSAVRKSFHAFEKARWQADGHGRQSLKVALARRDVRPIKPNSEHTAVCQPNGSAALASYANTVGDDSPFPRPSRAAGQPGPRAENRERGTRRRGGFLPPRVNH